MRKARRGDAIVTRSSREKGRNAINIVIKAHLAFHVASKSLSLLNIAYRLFVSGPITSEWGARSHPSDAVPTSHPTEDQMLPTSHKRLSSEISASSRSVVPNHPRAKEYIANFSEQRTRRPRESPLRRERTVWPESTKPLDEDVGHWLLRKKASFFAFWERDTHAPKSRTCAGARPRHL